MPQNPHIALVRAENQEKMAGDSVLFPVPPPPPGLLTKNIQRWNEFWSSPLVRLIVPELDLDAIETLFQLRDERERALRAGRKQRLVPGSAGQSVLNPLLAYAASLQTQIRACEDRLAVTPKARMSLGALYGEAKRGLDDLNAELDRDGDLGDLLDDDELDRASG